MVRIEDLQFECRNGNASENGNGNAEAPSSSHPPSLPSCNRPFILVPLRRSRRLCHLPPLPAEQPQALPPEQQTTLQQQLEELGSLDCISVKHNIHSSFKRCKRNVMSFRESFPEELIFNILLWLPAQIIHDVMRYICRRWYAMIHTHHFVHEHLLQSTAGLIVVRTLTPNHAYFVETQQGRLEVSKFHLGSQDIVWASCNGLVLVRDYHDCWNLLRIVDPLTDDRNLLRIVNPITKQRLTLPPFFRRMRYPRVGLAFVGASQEYKVVYSYGNEFCGPREPKCAILTVGVDKVWRHIDLGHLACVHEEVFPSVPYVTGEFVHWTRPNKKIVSTLNLQTETFMQFPVPQDSEKRHKMFLKMGSNLSLLASCGPLSWDIWALKSETGEWTKLPNIDLEAQRCKLELLFCTHECTVVPIRWLKPREVLIFRVSKPLKVWLIYDLKTLEIQSFELESSDFSDYYVVHVNSLVWLEGQ